MTFAIEPMKMEDIPEVVEVERACFTMPWPASAYKRELKNPKSTRYLVARHYIHPTGPGSKPGLVNDSQALNKRNGLLHSLLPFMFNDEEGAEHQRNHNPVIGYGGVWLMMDEAHITTLGVSPKYRGQSIGELLLAGLIEVAFELGASWLTLEVRVSNIIAQKLYEKYTFRQAGLRKKYYTDNNEDAYIMWSDEITKLSFRENFFQQKKNLLARLEAKGHLSVEQNSEGSLFKPGEFANQGETPLPENSTPLSVENTDPKPG